MDSQFHRLQWGCIFLLLFFAVSCSLQWLKKPEGEKEFFQETCRLERLAHNHPDPSVRAQSHRKLAFLYVNHRNPQLDYTRALQEMESYLSLMPTKKETDDFQNWLAILKEIEKLQASLEKAEKGNRNLREEVAGLKETIDRLKSVDLQLERAEKANRNLREEVAGLKKTIDGLKRLDRQMEEKRRLTK